MKLAEVATSPEFWDPDKHPPSQELKEAKEEPPPSPPIESEKTISNPAGEGSTWKCWFCDERLDFGGMWEHVEGAHKKKHHLYFCEICFGTFHSKVSCLLHNLNANV